MKSFSELINSDTPVLVDFFAVWCGPCKTMSPILKQIKDHFNEKLHVIKIDVDKNPSAAAAYKIRGVPTLMLFKNGQQKWTQSGVIPYSELTDVIKPHLNM